MTDYLFDKTGDDPEVRALEEQLAVFAHRAPLRAPPPRATRRWTLAATAVVALAAVVFVAVWRWPRPTSAACAPGPGFAFAVSGGPAQCAGGVAARGALPVGAWLETSRSAIADVRIADIGNLTVFGDTRVRLVGTGATGHRLELARGRLSARVVAPPRLFVIDTPGATAVDLGCAYELSVDDLGHTRLRVTSGAVSLEGKGVASYAPVDTEVVAVPGQGPGIPVAIGADRPLRAAVARFDAGERAALAEIVAQAGRRDAITLWNLLARTTDAERGPVVDRLAALSGVPDDVRVDDLRRGDRDAIERWRVALEDDWGCLGCGAGTKGKR